MVVEFIGGPQDGEHRDIPDEMQAHSYEWRFPLYGIPVSGGIGLQFPIATKQHVYKRDSGSDKFKYCGIQ